MSRFFPDLRAEDLERALEPLMAAPLPLLLVLFAVLPPLCEELLCRGFLLSGFRARFGDGKAVWLSAALFGALHMEFTRILPTAEESQQRRTVDHRRCANCMFSRAYGIPVCYNERRKQPTRGTTNGPSFRSTV